MNRSSSQARRHFLKGAAGAFALALAGCQSGPSVETPPPPTAAPPVSEVPDEVEVGKNGVAVLVPLSGDNAAIGQSIANAATMALLDAGEDRLSIEIYDTADSGGAAGAAQEALADGNGLILGPLLSENVNQVAPVARAENVPVIAFSNDESVAGGGVYIMGFVPAQSVERVVDYALDQGGEVFAGIAPNGLYGQRTSQTFLRHVEERGGRVAVLENFERSRASVEDAARAVASTSGVDYVLIADSGQVAQLAAPSLQLSGTLMGTELWAASENLGEVAPMRGAIYAAVPDRQFQSFVTRYRSRYNAAPYRLSSLGYDAMLLAIRLAENWDIGGRFPEGELRDDDGFGGVDGIFRFGRDGVAERALEVRRVTAGGSEVVSPASTSFDD